MLHKKASVLDAIKASAQPDEHFVCGDSVYEMERTLDDESIDCVITDPPYDCRPFVLFPLVQLKLIFCVLALVINIFHALEPLDTVHDAVQPFFSARTLNAHVLQFFDALRLR